VIWFFCLRLRQHSIERAMDLTGSFTWEDLPTSDPDTGHLTAAGWIPRINMFTSRAGIAVILFHFTQSTIRIVTNHETLFIAWFSFDWTVSPFYELFNISQVTTFECHKNKNKNPFQSVLLLFLIRRLIYTTCFFQVFNDALDNILTFTPFKDTVNNHVNRICK
jgi:ABC-type uncharacterized transport system permease subunit